MATVANTPKTAFPVVSASEALPQAISSQHVLDLAKARLDTPAIPFSGASLGVMAQVADMTYAVRTFPDLASTLPACPDALKPLADGNTVSFYHTQGITTGLNFFWGICFALPTIKELQRAQQCGDKEGERAAIVSLTRDACMAGGGFLFMAHRPLALASALTGASAASFTAPSTLGSATFGTGMVGIGLFGGFYGLLAYESYEGFRSPDIFLADLAQASDKRAFLQGKLQLSPKEIEAIDTCSDEQLNQMREQEIEWGAQELLALFKESGRTDVPQTLEACTTLYQALLDKDFPVATDAEVNFLRTRAKGRLLMVKEMALTRLLGAGLVARVKIATAENTGALVTEVQQALTTSSTLSKTEFAVYLLGFIATILFFATITGGWGAVIAAALFVIVTIGMLCTDGFRLYQAVQSGKVAEGDSTLIMTSMAILTAMTIAALCLSCLVFPPALLPILVTLLSYAGTMSLSGAVLYHVHQAQSTDAYKKNLEIQEQLKEARQKQLSKFCDNFIQKQTNS